MRRHAETHGPLLALILLAYSPFLSTWWFHDDWVFLANAAGLEARANPLARIVSYQLYWRLFWPVFGLHTWPWALTRLTLHFASAVLVSRLGFRTGLSRTAAGLAALFFAAGPLVFESLYWGTGAVELLWVFFTLFALERWLAGGRRNQWIALGLAALAVGSKEVAVFLPLLFAWDLWRRKERPVSPPRWGLWTGVAAVFLLGMAGIWLIFRDVQGTGDYGLALGLTPRVFGLCGLWLIFPIFLLREPVASSLPALAGALVWAGWLVVALRRRRRGSHWSLALLVTAVLMVAPVAVLGDHMVPRYLYGPLAAFSLFLLGSWPQRLGQSTRSLWLGACLLAALALLTTDYQLEARWPQGRLVHRLVFKEEVSRAARQRLEMIKLESGDRLVVHLGPRTDQKQESILKDCLGEDRAFRLMLGHDLTVEWVRELGPEHRGTFVIPTEGANLLPGGRFDPE